MTNDLANAARIMSERIVRLEAHQCINEQKIEEQTREIERLRDALEDLLARAEQLAHAEMTDIHSYTTCTPGDSDNADRGCPACLAREALKGGKP